MPGHNSASNLEGKIIGDWQVGKKRIRTPEDSSGSFGTCYEVINVKTGREGFLKAFNYFYAFQATQPLGKSPVDIINEMTANFIYERNLYELCNGSKLDRIVAAIDHGSHKESDQEPWDVPYVVFEKANQSLKTIHTNDVFNIAWKLRCIHGILVGLSQLHYRKIVHQDIKASNILIFGDNFAKISDLGNATQFENASPGWDKDEHCGDFRYAPIELLYYYISPDWDTRRFGADLFMVGGLIIYMLTGNNLLVMMRTEIPDDIWWTKFDGTFHQALPHIMGGYNSALQQVEACIPDDIRGDLMEVISQLTHPEPEKRGLPNSQRTSMSKYSLQRYISILDRLARKKELSVS